MDNELSSVKKDRTFLAACVIYLTVLLLFIGLRILFGLDWFDNMSEKSSDLLFSIVSQFGIMFLLPLLGMVYYKKKLSAKNDESYRDQSYASEDNVKVQPSGTVTVLKNWGFGKPKAKVLGFSVVLGVLLYIFNIFVAGLFFGILTMLGYRFPVQSDSPFTGLSGFFITLILVAVLPGICEETAHRGLLLRSFASKLGVMKAVLFSSLIFGLMHLNIVQCVYAAVLGYLIALAVLATRSIWTGVIMHFMNNAIGVFFSFATVNGWKFGDLASRFADWIGQFGFIVIFAFIFGVYCLIIAIINMFARENFRKDNPDYVVTKLKLFKATPFYLNNGRKAEPMTAGEKSLFYGVIFLGGIVTVFTFVWGML